MKTQEFVDTDLVSGASRGGTIPGAEKSIVQASTSQVEIDSRVEEARQQILELRRQQDELEKLRQELEDLRRRQEEFENGKAQMLEELSRTITRIEQEEFEVNQRALLLTNSRELYQDYVRQLHDIRESEWARDDLKAQLAKAVAVVEAARAEMNKGRAQLTFLGDGPVKSAQDSSPAATPVIEMADRGPFNFKVEFQRGLARSLPLIITLGLIALILLTRGK